MDHETTTEKQSARRAITTESTPKAAGPELTGQAMPVGGLLSGGDFAAMSVGELGSRARVLTRLQRSAGNGAASVVAASARAQRRPRSGTAGVSTVMRTPDDETTYHVTEAIGPVAGSDYTVVADSLAAFADAITARDEAGRVQWSPSFDYDAPAGTPRTVTVSVTCPIGLEMPSWSLPEDMGPRTRAEYSRWLAALRTHEQGHIDRVHSHFDGLAERMARRSFTRAQQLFNTTKTNLQTASDTYDASTSHGISQGTTLDLSIEEEERAESEEEEEEVE